jgi:IS5 family transposase
LSEPRYHDTRKDSFYGDFLYDRIVPRGHFLRQADAVVPWDEYGAQLLHYYKGGAEYGRPPWNPVLMLKVLFLAHLYGLSRRETEVYLNENMPAKWFVGIAADEGGPDYSTIADFQSRLSQNGKVAAFEKLLDQVIALAKAKGVVFGSIQIIDSVHVVANVNTAKDDASQKQGELPRDPNARWGVKHSHKVLDENGQEKRIPEYFFGYKQHVSMNAASRLITSVAHTAGNEYDGHQLPGLVEHDLALGIPVQIVTADRGLDDGDNHCFLKAKKLHSAIRLNKGRFEKNDPNKAPWIKLRQTPEYREGLQVRSWIEPKFGEAKEQHRFRRCHGVGLPAFKVQGLMTAITMNIKRIVLLVTGTPFSPGITAPLTPWRAG